MAPDVKFCGLTRAEDAAHAVALGAAYTGVIFAGGPRQLDAARARAVLDGAGNGARRVGVFAAQPASEIAATARSVGLDVVQLHGDSSAAAIDAAREATGGEVWAVLRIRGAELPPEAADAFAAADAVVLDALVDGGGALGGTGVMFDWAAGAAAIERLRSAGRARLVLAGGLRPENVARAIDLIAPDVVDVSSGVESSPGIKDHARMRAFTTAVRQGARR